MNKTILKKYYEMQGKVILPEQKENDNIELAATVAANFASIGFPMTNEQTKSLAKADKKDILAFYKDNYAMLSDVIGAGKQPKPFYPDFPEGRVQGRLWHNHRPHCDPALRLPCQTVLSGE